MELLKKEERALRAQDLRRAIKGMGWGCEDLGTWCRWKKVRDGKLQVSLTIWKLNDPTQPVYVLEDSLGKVATCFIKDKQEIISFLKGHGFKPEKQWYIEDYGMDEETWRAWNNLGEDEDR